MCNDNYSLVHTAVPEMDGVVCVCVCVRTQMRSCVITTLPLRQARCSAVRPSPSPHVSFTSSREPCASSSTTKRRSSSAVACSSCCPRVRSTHGRDATNNFCSYLARIQRSRSSLKHTHKELILGGQEDINVQGRNITCSHWSNIWTQLLFC